MDLPGPHQPPLSVLDSKPAPSTEDLVCLWSDHLFPAANCLFRPFLALWKLTEVSFPLLAHISLLMHSFSDTTIFHVAGTVATIQPTLVVNAIPTSPAQHFEMVHLLYSLVPGMDTNSAAFQKAISTLNKQQAKALASPSGTSIACFKQAKLDHISSHQDLSKLFFILSLCCMLISASYRLFTCSSCYEQNQQAPHQARS